MAAMLLSGDVCLSEALFLLILADLEKEVIGLMASLDPSKLFIWYI